MWMLLLLDVDQDASTGWLGYDYLINEPVLNSTQTTVKQYALGKWVLAGEAEYRMNGNGLELKLGRKMLGETECPPAFDFHWADAIQNFDGVEQLGLNGDNAPNRRWNYRFEVSKPLPSNK